MDTVDLKGIAWVGNIYQKFEALCLEAEEAMYEETAKYVENQVQIMGASVKRFYSDVIQDLGPPSSADPVKVAAADLPLNPYADVGIHKKPKENIKEHTKKHVHIKGFSKKGDTHLSEKSSLSRVVPKNQSPALSIPEVREKDESVCNEFDAISRLASVDVEEKVCNSSSDADEVQDDTSIATATSRAVPLVESSANKGKELGYMSSSDTVSAEPTERCGDCQLISQMGSQPRGIMHYGKSDDDGLYMSHTGSSGDCNTENDDCLERRVETAKVACQLNLEETCVLVEENVYSDCSNQRKNKSYKKKIQQAFSLKMKSARKQEYQQLAALYHNTNISSISESIETAMPALAADSNSKSLQTCDFLELEWELL